MSQIENKKRRNYQNDQKMLEALAAFENGVGKSLRKIAKEHGVDPKSLRRRAKQEIEIDAKTGRYQILNSEEEKAFVNLCISMSKIGVALTRKMLKNQIKQFCQEKGIVIKGKNGPSEKYMCQFLKRNPDISIRVPQGIKPQAQSQVLETVHNYLQLVLLFSLFFSTASCNIYSFKKYTLDIMLIVFHSLLICLLNFYLFSKIIFFKKN